MIQWTKLLTVVLIITTIVAVAALSVPVIIKEINLGTDLRGGVYVLLEAQAREGSNPVQEESKNLGWWQRFTDWFDNLFGGDEDQGEAINAEDMAGTIAVLSNRVDSFGLAEATIQQEGSNRIRVELTADPSNPSQNQQQILDIIGTTAQLEFRNSKGETVLTGANLTNARAAYQPDEYGRQAPVVGLEFDQDGARIFGELTSSHIGQQIPIYLDGAVISSPVVNHAITDGKAVITGIGSIEDAAELANLLRSGALPLELTQLEVRTVGPLLGADSLNRSLVAGLIGMALVIIFMLAFYRIPGLLASFALMAYVVLVLGVLVAINAVLTLPGIAGLILTIGMAVDANVIILERMKEELRIGKTPRASVLSGFSKAFSSILDSNVTTLIVAAVLFRFGTGSVRGFAITLAVGVIVSMFTAITVSRALLVNLVNSNAIKNLRLLGVNK